MSPIFMCFHYFRFIEHSYVLWLIAVTSLDNHSNNDTEPFAGN